MSDLARYIGLPWACPDNPPLSYDCWSLTIAARRDLGLWTPTVRDAHSIDAFLPAVQEELASGRWRQVPRKMGVGGEVVLLGNEKLSHCGVLIGDSMVMHAFSANGETGAVRCDPWRLIEMLFRQREVWTLCRA